MDRAWLKFFLASLFTAPLAGAQAPTASPSANPSPSSAPNIATDPKAVFNLSVEMQSYLEPFIYDMKDRKDPFKPFVESIGGPTGEGAFEGPLLPLQRFDMDDLRLIGIIWDVKEPKAMFMDPESKVHILSRDDRIGKNNGYVAAIREGEVVVVETIRAKGESITTSRVLKISR